MPKLFENEIVNTEEELSEQKTPKGSQEEGSGEEEGTGSGTGTGTGSGEGTGEDGSGEDDGTGTGSEESEEGSKKDSTDKEGSGSAASGSKESSEKASSEPKEKTTKKDDKKVEPATKATAPKTKDEKPTDKKTKEDKPATGAGTGNAAGVFTGKLFKKGRGGRKKTEERNMKLEGTTLSYFKSQTDLESNKKGKTVDLNNATVALSKKEDKKMVWITITTSSKKEKIVREIAAKNKDEADTWVARLTQASGGKAAAAPSVKAKGNGGETGESRNKGQG